MKKFVLVLVAIAFVTGTISVFAAEKITQPPTNQAPVTSVKPTDVVTITTDFKPINDRMICPYCQNNGNVLFEKKVMPFQNNKPFFHCRFNRMPGLQGPRIFRWIGMGIKFVAFLLFWILLIVLMVVFIRWVLKPHHHHFSSCCHHDSNAMDILKDRYAKGEINSEQFEEMKSKLN